MGSRPACDTYNGCLTETAAPNKLQADMDTHPKDYFIPNFGVDRDILDTQSNLKNAAKGKKALMQTVSRPACDTYNGCLTETAAPNKLQADMDTHPKDYFIPNFGVDRDVLDTQAHYKKA